MYSSLEPCGACAKIIAEIGIKKVVYCLVDPLLSHYGRTRNPYFDKKILFYRHNSPRLIAEFQKIYSELYKRKIDLVDKSKILEVLSYKKLRENIIQRLEKYWRSIKLPYEWIPSILKILLKNKDNIDLAIKEVRRKFPSITQENSLNYSKKLTKWRKRKVKNLSKKLNKYIIGRTIADIGGRTGDFVEQILTLNKSIKKAYVTDIDLFSTESKNHKINFIVQSSNIELPFKKSSIDTIILSMVLHHLKTSDQKNLMKNIIFSLRDGGRVILIEDTYPEVRKINTYSQNINDFLKFTSEEKRKILSFYDWFGNILMRNRDNTPLFYNYRTMEDWKKIFEKYGMKQIKSEFIKENRSNLSLFPPKAIMVFQK